ncbi:MAG: hypothetical protein ACRYFK_08020 [Janthinobacterium lividum]
MALGQPFTCLDTSAHPLPRDGNVVQVSDRVPDLIKALASVVVPPGR